VDSEESPGAVAETRPWYEAEEEPLPTVELTEFFDASEDGASALAAVVEPAEEASTRDDEAASDLIDAAPLVIESTGLESEHSTTTDVVDITDLDSLLVDS